MTTAPRLEIANQDPGPHHPAFARMKTALRDWSAALAGPMSVQDGEQLPALAVQPASTPAHVLAITSRAPSAWSRAHAASELPRWRWG